MRKASGPESVHPSCQGLFLGYSKLDHDEYSANFSNRWMELYGNDHIGSMELCMEAFHHKFNDVWADLVVKLETWVEAHDVELEPTENDPTSAI